MGVGKPIINRSDMDQSTKSPSGSNRAKDAPVKRPDPKVAEQALVEAEARRAQYQQEREARELNGRAGPDPARYGDWENKGIASDF